MAASFLSPRALLRALIPASIPYNQRATRVDADLWLGPELCKRDAAELRSMRVALIIDCGENDSSKFVEDQAPGIVRMRCMMPAAGSSIAVDRSMLWNCLEASEHALARQRVVLVHGRDEAFRASSVAYGILRVRGSSMIQAARAVARYGGAIPAFIEQVEHVIMRKLPLSRWNP
jgi:hypothetical protein